MPDERFLIVKLGSLGDLVFTLPAVAALRQAHPAARIDWVVERHWYPLIEGNPDLTNVVILDRASTGSFLFTAWRLRTARYTCAIDFQGLYKSAVLARFAGAPVRFGFTARFAREPASALLYTRRVTPRGAHMVEQNMSLVAPLGAGNSHYRFPLRVRPQAEARLRANLAAEGLLGDFFVLSPGGGWRSKCWPPDRYGELHRRLARRTGLRGVISFGPGERELAEAVRLAAGAPAPAILDMDVAQLMALVRGARFLVSGDSGPLHLAAAFGTPVVGLYGPTPPERNGPFPAGGVVVRNARPEETTFRRGRRYSPAMLSITVDQVLAAVERRLGNTA
ncbi:MAG TPA: glycosyltransferase family 9 protein [Patescibacteria group bacterium]|nr:glycosyltransferase family 9 protein [Patescibacteria group bacterium]